MHAALHDALHPVLNALDGLDLSNPQAAATHLRSSLDADAIAAFQAALRDAHAAGTLTPREAGPHVRFGRVAKAADTPTGHSIDAVDIAGAGAPHTHPKGEVSWCIPLEGTPTFEGVSEGWAILPPGSRHTPTVHGGRMLIVYFLPEGAVDWNA